jgi:hypothetical protein
MRTADDASLCMSDSSVHGRVDIGPIAKPWGITHSGFECELGRAGPCMAMIQAPFLWSPRTP